MTTSTTNPQTAPLPTSAQLKALVHALTTTDRRQLKEDMKSEKATVKAEYKAHKQEIQALPRCERKAAKHALKAQLFADVLGRFAEKLGERHGSQVTVAAKEKDDAAVVISPPGYEQVVEQKDVKA